jgi:threonylcarbamoyladenosine tRNA methylthiotransferase MtaB
MQNDNLKLRISFTTFGCKTNHYDTDVMAGACIKAGFNVVNDAGRADICVVNTCTVTGASDAQGRNIVRRIIRANPRAKVIVCGCSSQIDPVRYKNIEGVDHVLGVCAAKELVDIVEKHFAPARRHSPARGEGNVPAFSPSRGEGQGEGDRYCSFQSRARAFLKIQDGCDRRCAYCIVSTARGKSISVSVQDVIRKRDELIDAGFKEIVLTGIHIGRFGSDLEPRTSLARLVAELADHPGRFKIRVSSLDPEEADDETIAALNHPKVCRHVHLSLQSGSNMVLRMMDRGGDVKYYAERVKFLAQAIPGISIGADVIAGFPGETDELFDETKRFVEGLPFTYLHVFPFSPRPGTKAAAMQNQVPERIRKERAGELKKISDRKRENFYRSQKGEILEAVIVSKRPDKEGRFSAVSDNYIPVMVKGKGVKYKDMVSVSIDDYYADEKCLTGSVI